MRENLLLFLIAFVIIYKEEKNLIGDLIWKKLALPITA